MRGVNGNEYDNVSTDNAVGFIENTHKYILIEKPELEFNSVTTLIKEFEEDEFISDEKALECSLNKKSQYFGRSVEDILREWKEASEMGTRLHTYGEHLLNKVPSPTIPDSPKAKWVPEIINYLFDNGYEVAITELLVYSIELKLAGQSDIILKKKNLGGEYDFMIYDWKFLKEPIKKKSYYNPKLRTYKKMGGPFKYLSDCNWVHYSIQLAIYQTLTGEPEKVKEKVLVVVNEDKYEFVPCYPMRVFWDECNQLQAVYEIWDGRWYDSRFDSLYKTKPRDIKGI